MTLAQTLILGAVGGLLPDVLRIVGSRHDGRVPAFLRSLKFWFSLVLLAGVGAFAAWLLGAAATKDAFIYGFTAPEVLSKLAATAAGAADRGGGRMSILDWWGK